MRVVLATDGSSGARGAVEWLRRLPLPPDREVMVITVVAPPSFRFPGTAESSSDSAQGRLLQARQLADDTASRLLTGRSAIGRVVQGDPPGEIIAAARGWDADLIVLGARGLGRIRGFLLGSVSLDVVRGAPCPVLVCKGIPRDLGTVTAALDGSKHAREALDWFARLPLASPLRLRLVAVVDDLRHSKLKTELGAVAHGLRPRFAHVDVAVTTGEPAAEIVRNAERHGSDLLVVGARGVGAAARVLLGSVSESILRLARSPVLVVHPRAVRRRT